MFQNEGISICTYHTSSTMKSRNLGKQVAKSWSIFDFAGSSFFSPRDYWPQDYILKVFHYWVHQTLNRFSTPNYTEKTLTPVPNSREGCDCTNNTAMHKLNLLILLHVMWNVIFPEIFTRRHKFWETTQLYPYWKGLMTVYLTAILAFRPSITHHTTSVFHADQHGIGQFFLSGLGHRKSGLNLNPGGTPLRQLDQG